MERLVGLRSEEESKGAHEHTHCLARKKEEYLLYENGKLNIKQKQREGLEFMREIPHWSARFQVNRKLYIWGG